MQFVSWALIVFFKFGSAGGATTVHFDTEDRCLTAKAQIEAQYAETWTTVQTTCVEMKD